MVTRGEQREDAILLAVLELLAEVGYDQMTMDGVAARAHASKATIYRRWPGKAELVVTAVKRHSGSPWWTRLTPGACAATCSESCPRCGRPWPGRMRRSCSG
ncbi:helix-turn-helix domain-containing protein [Amycolatopsis sp.]|uniref:helix-turn-helix domain-containing protein n=1 Tax=Amycolatopsis sp. TaxID=37632 RepID=UPI00260597D9|nr:helix-turn-helix domain-containing protein [Amycolatopsis sp.]